MAAAYTVRVIVLRKTKLGESDLILTLMAEDGSQIRAVAKGARKPKSPFASRLELFSTADVMVNSGRSLDVICEARLARNPGKLRSEAEYATGAAPIAELLERVTQMGLENPKLFAMSDAALAKIDEVDTALVPSITAGHLLKALSLAGFRPSISTCALCGSPVGLGDGGEAVHVSYEEGGVVCSRCAHEVETIRMQAALCAWVDFLITSTFDAIECRRIGPEVSLPVLQFAQSWIRQHVGRSLKSLEFLFASGFYGEG